MLAALGLLAIAAAPSRADVLDFEDIILGADGTANVFGFYEPPASHFIVLGDVQARGLGASSALTPATSEGSGMVTTSLAPFGGTIVTLTHENSLPFTLESINLAREFQFNNPSAGVSYPEVTFTGTTVGGGTVMQTFSVDQEGFFFRTFTFSSVFTNLLTVNWTQPVFGSPDPNNPGQLLGLHQFDNIVVNVIPEPSSLAMLGLGMLGLSLGWARRAGGPDNVRVVRVAK
jgi:hypothetical protein